MTKNSFTYDKQLILQAEIAALLHDIGKFSEKFILKGTKTGENLSQIHTVSFMTLDQEMISEELADILNRNLPEKWLQDGSTNPQLLRLGDLLKLHHITKDESLIQEFNTSGPVYPMLFYLMLYADIIDSSSSKGGAAFSAKNNRKPALDNKPFLQDPNHIFLSTPFGERESDLILENDSTALKSKIAIFHQQLAQNIEKFQNWDSLDRLKTGRAKLLSLMQKHLSKALAETRQPTNDVSLWQHCYSTASIFKAMLARHLILHDFIAHEDGRLLHHKEKLAYIGVRWREDQILERAVRPKDILGRRHRLFGMTEHLKAIIETEYCLGNEIYRDRNGICFLTPDPSEQDIGTLFEEVCNVLENCLNNEDYFPGDLRYQIVFNPVGIQVLGLADILEGNGQILRDGPFKPKWMAAWESSSARHEICSRCGLRPVELVPSSTGSERDVGKVCAFCEKLTEDTGKDRLEISGMHLGLVKEAKFFTFETDKLISDESENSRLALVQGIFDLRGFFSGTAFSSLLARRPEDYLNDRGPEDKSRDIPINSWNTFLSGVKDHWEKIAGGPVSKVSQHLFQQIFHDTYLGEAGDGRVAGNKNEKLKTYIKDIVLASPFPEGLEDFQKIAIHALRLHPAPSRIMRAWETTAGICRHAMRWCESEEVRYFPLSIDPGRFLVLVPAANAWNLLQGMYQEYVKRCGRVRHLLPFHLSASIFYRKFPLYIGIDTMRRFAASQLDRKHSEIWELEEKQEEKSGGDTIAYRLKWNDEQRRPITWRMPAKAPNGKEERFFSWFWLEGRDYPVCLHEVKPGNRAIIRPSTFDYEVLDSTSRRYDIRMGDGGQSRPHHFTGESGPRPYPLEELQRWEIEPEIMELGKIDYRQISRLISFVGTMHSQWLKAENPAVFEAQAKDYLRICLEKDSLVLTDLAVSGAIFDVVEWNHFISK